MTIEASELKCDFIGSVPTQHSQKTSIQHWQLRDLLCLSPEDSRQLFSVYHSQVFAYDHQKRTASFLLRDLAFQPTCISAAHGYLAVGGQRSQVAIRSLNSDWMAATSVGGAINNCVHIAQHSGHSRLFVCNNDETIKIYELPSMELVKTIRLSVAVNGVSVSPDGTKMIAVGDSNQVFMYNIDASGHYEQFGTLTTSKDAGFSCSWDQSSTKFAVGCQDGFVCVWDVRNSKKLAQIASTQPNGRGAVRAVKFTHSGSIDLLAFSEHTTYFNVIDARTFDGRDSIRVALTGQTSSAQDLNISGLAFSENCSSLFVATEQAVLEYDVNTRKRRGSAAGQIL